MHLFAECIDIQTGIACHSEDMFVSHTLELAWSFFSCWMYDDPVGFSVSQGSKCRANALLHLAQDFETKPSPQPELMMELS